MMNTVIIEDDNVSLSVLKQLLQQINMVKEIHSFTNPLEGKEFVLKHEVDVIFLDIHFSGVNGIELAEQISNYKPNIIIVFVTSYDKFAVDAFELNAIDYLVKPIKEERLALTMDRIKTQLETEQAKRPTELLYIYTSNQLMFAIDEKESVTLEWRTAKAQELFLYLLYHHDTIVRRDVLIDLLWDNYEMNRAYSLLYTTVYHVRKLLKQYDTHFVLENINEGYILKLKNVTIDLVEWERLVSELPSLNELTVQQYEQVLMINKGPYLANNDFYWAESERYHLEKIWTNIALKIANFYKTNNQLEKALDMYTKVCLRDKESEQAYLRKMQIYDEMNDQQAVKKEYATLKSILKDEFGAEPSYYVKEWYTNWFSQI